jgi:hypothetical protein
MSDLTFMQRLLRRPINYAVERFFPNGCFYGDSDPMQSFEKAGGGIAGRSATLVLIRKGVERGDGFNSVSLRGVTINGEDVGDWVVTVRRVKP